MLVDRPSAGLVAVYCVSRGLSVCVAVTVSPARARSRPPAAPRPARAASPAAASRSSPRRTSPSGNVARKFRPCPQVRSPAMSTWSVPLRSVHACPGAPPPPPRRERAGGGARAGRGRRGGGVRRVPDLPRVRLAVLAAVGGGGPAAGSCRASTPTARRPSTRCCCRSGSCSRRSATPGARAFVALCLAGMVALVVAMYRLGRLVAGVPGRPGGRRRCC